jgi:hypothetical protein
VVFEFLRLEMAALLLNNMLGEVKHVLRDLHVLDVSELLGRVQDLVWITQKHAQQAFIPDLKRDHMLAVGQHDAMREVAPSSQKPAPSSGERTKSKPGTGLRIKPWNEFRCRKLPDPLERVTVPLGSDVNPPSSEPFVLFRVSRRCSAWPSAVRRSSPIRDTEPSDNHDTGSGRPSLNGLTIRNVKPTDELIILAGRKEPARYQSSGHG